MPSEPQPNRIAQLWKTYKKSASKDLRNQLIENYLPLVRNHAERLKAKLPSVVQVDDLTTAGVLGLMDAIEQFAPDRKVKFETFSAIRIRGAMMDELRGLDWVPRLGPQGAEMPRAATRAPWGAGAGEDARGGQRIAAGGAGAAAERGGSGRARERAAGRVPSDRGGQPA